MSRVSGVAMCAGAFGNQKSAMPRTRKVLQALCPPNPVDNMKRGMAGAAIAATSLYMGQVVDNPDIVSTGVVLATWAKSDVTLGFFRSIIQHLLPR